MGLHRTLLIAWIVVQVTSDIVRTPAVRRGEDELPHQLNFDLFAKAQQFYRARRIYGRLGTNYFNDNGRPYINCVYDRRSPENETTSAATTATTVPCYLNMGRRERPGCMAIFVYNGSNDEYLNDPDPTAKVVITAQDCWQHADDTVESCANAVRTTGGPACLFREKLNGSTVYFCCCDEHNCNDAVILRPVALINETALSNSTFNITDLENFRGDETKMSFNDMYHNRKKESPKKELNIQMWILIGSLAVLFFIAFLALCICCLRYRKKRVKASEAEAALLEAEKKKNEKPKEPLLDVRDLVELGKGHFAKVYKGLMVSKEGDEKIVAVKVFTNANFESFVDEKNIYMELSQRPDKNMHILNYMGWDDRGDDHHWIVTEYHQLGNLKEFLTENTVTVPQALRIMTSALNGLSFLHEERLFNELFLPTICHRDLKATNILLYYDDHRHIKSCIGDFGLALKCDPIYIRSLTGHAQSQVGTKRYMAPEVLEGATEFTQGAFRQIDVYAMGLIMWEVLNRTDIDGDPTPLFKMAYEAELGPVISSISYMREAVCRKRIRPTFRESLLRHANMAVVCTTAAEMWDDEAEARISACCALQRLRQLSGEDSEGYHSAVDRRDDIYPSAEATPECSQATMRFTLPPPSSVEPENAEYIELVAR